MTEVYRPIPALALVRTGGVMRCCLADLPDRIPSGPIEPGWVLRCPYCEDGLRWTGEVWQGAWIAWSDGGA